MAAKQPVLLLPAALPAVAAVLFHRRTLRAQLLARALIWAPLILSMLLAHLEAYMDRQPNAAMGMVVSGALALLAAGRVGTAWTPAGCGRCTSGWAASSGSGAGASTGSTSTCRT